MTQIYLRVEFEYKKIQNKLPACGQTTFTQPRASRFFHWPTDSVSRLDIFNGAQTIGFFNAMLSCEGNVHLRAPR